MELRFSVRGFGRAPFLYADGGNTIHENEYSQKSNRRYGGSTRAEIRSFVLVKAMAIFRRFRKPFIFCENTCIFVLFVV